jgi:hypothetical protein
MVNKIKTLFTIRGILFSMALIVLLGNSSPCQTGSSNLEKLKISYMGDAKIEVGNVYTGLSFHHSYPVPQRISFYYPAANSIDNSTDYWFRDTTFVMDAGLRFGNENVEWLNKQSLPYDLTPFSVSFTKQEANKKIDITYQFTKKDPAAVVSYTVKNLTNRPQQLTLYVRFALALHTCHSYHYKEPSVKAISGNGKTVTARFNDGETKNPELFILSGSYTPAVCQIIESKSQNNDTLKTLFPGYTFVSAPAVNYIYTLTVPSGKSVTIAKVFGSTIPAESETVQKNLSAGYKKEVSDFENSILHEVFDTGVFTTGDSYLDRSVRWSQTMLRVSKHYIDGDITPMPCPAEYNFYFTHDVLLTDLAAVKFDLPRVKNDLGFILKRSSAEKIIPHAYYWMDTAYVTEFADHDNWNNFWFIIVCSEYLKHSADTAFTNVLFPYIEKSLKQALLTKGDDDLMWSIRPDWWDIGTRYGQRSYMTLLAIRALRSYIYVSTVLGKDDAKLTEYEQLSDRMSKALNEKLWSEKDGFLMSNTDPGVKDEHIYSGSLLAAHYGLLDSTRIRKTIATADKILVDPKVGVCVVSPMDFDKLSNLWHFAGNEVGAKYYYINGGIWPHANSWYALALIAGGMRDTAYRFIRNVMSINGIIDGPNGQPAMYEVRNANHEDPKTYGTIDKPQFMWAAGWYLYSLYSLFGVEDNEWNTTFSPYLKADQKAVDFTLTVHNKKSDVSIHHGAKAFVTADGKELHSYIVPAGMKTPAKIGIGIGTITSPYVKTTNSILDSVSLLHNELHICLRAFIGHRNETVILSTKVPAEVLINGKPVATRMSVSDGVMKTVIQFTHTNRTERVVVKF